MLRKKDFLEKIVHELNVYIQEIEMKAENNLLDDNVLSEDFVKSLLNVCMGWDLENLNVDTDRFPGIDLGDKGRRIGVQVTSTKTGKKMEDSLDKIVSNGVDSDFCEIYFFILGKKQGSYSIDFEKYPTLECSESNIWDVHDVMSWCKHYDSSHIMRVWGVIERELVCSNIDNRIPVEFKKCILGLKNTIQGIFDFVTWAIQTHSTRGFDIVSNDTLVELDKMLPYLDEKTYSTCKEIFESGIAIGDMLCISKRWGWEIEAKYRSIQSCDLVKNNLKEAVELIEKDTPGLPKGIDIIIDGDCLFDRLNALEIDFDILCRQFSVKKFRQIIEDTIFRKSRNCQIVFSGERKSYAKVGSRLESEGIQVIGCPDRECLIQCVHNKLSDVLDVVLVSKNEDLLKKMSENRRNAYVYTVSFENELGENDLPTQIVPEFFSNGRITSYSLNKCFNYNECQRINIKRISEAAYKELLANANDCYEHQLRVDKSGDVYISMVTGARELDGVKFRWESWEPGNGYVGPRAASDSEYVKSSVASLKKCWEDDVSGYCDYY